MGIDKEDLSDIMVSRERENEPLVSWDVLKAEMKNQRKDTMDRDQLLLRIKSHLEAAHGDRLKGVLLYGSEARGEAGADSDIDVLVLLAGPIDWWDDISTNVKAIYDLVLEIERPIHAMPANVDDFNRGKCALYRNVQHEGIRL